MQSVVKPDPQKRRLVGYRELFNTSMEWGASVPLLNRFDGRPG